MMYSFVIVVQIVMTISIPNPVLGYLSEDQSHNERENDEFLKRRSKCITVLGTTVHIL